jgi:hypothetical protein
MTVDGRLAIFCRIPYFRSRGLAIRCHQNQTATNEAHLCEDSGWVCEEHPQMPAEGKQPRMPDGFTSRNKKRAEFWSPISGRRQRGPSKLTLARKIFHSYLLNVGVDPGCHALLLRELSSGSLTPAAPQSASKDLYAAISKFSNVLLAKLFLRISSPEAEWAMACRLAIIDCAVSLRLDVLSPHASRIFQVASADRSFPEGAPPLSL